MTTHVEEELRNSGGNNDDDGGDEVSRWLTAALTLVFGLWGVCGYGLYFGAAVMHRRRRCTDAFRTLTLSLSVSELHRNVQALLVALPATMAGVDRLPNWYRTVSGFFWTAAWFASLSQLLTIGGNRLICVYRSGTYKSCYTKAKSVGLLLACYFFGVFAASLSTFGNCRAEFVGHRWRLLPVMRGGGGDGGRRRPAECSDIVRQTLWHASNVLMAANLLVATAIVYGVAVRIRRFAGIGVGVGVGVGGATGVGGAGRCRRSSLGRRALGKQCSFTLQYAVTVALFSLYGLTLWLAPTLERTGATSPVAVAVAMNAIQLISASTIPYVYLLVGRASKRQVFELIKSDRSSMSSPPPPSASTIDRFGGQSVISDQSFDEGMTINTNAAE